MFRLTTENLTNKITHSLIKLRKEKHQAGEPFMITDDGSLSNNQAFLEFGDGEIQLVEFSNDYHNYEIISTLSKKESNQLRKKHHLK
jgi:hypothetical protein